MNGLFTLQQDDAPAHRARKTVQLLRKQMPDFMGPEMIWPLNSPDLNPVYYGMWGLLQGRVYHDPVIDPWRVYSLDI